MAITVLVLCTALPAMAQDDAPGAGSDFDLLRRGAEGLMNELFEELRPDLERLGRALGGLALELDRYHAPEILPNGDIILRRKRPDAAPPPEGAIDL